MQYFIISDLHLDEEDDKEYRQQLLDFIDYVMKNDGKLIIAGDLFECWFTNIGRVLNTWSELLDILYNIDTIYVIGNHDELLYELQSGPCQLKHRFFHKIYKEYNLDNIKIIHGHQYDIINQKQYILFRYLIAFYCMYFWLYKKAVKTPSILQYISNLIYYKWMQNFHKNIDKIEQKNTNSKIVYGHTHFVNKIDNKYNIGKFDKHSQTFAKIHNNTITLYSWNNGKPKIL